MISVKSYFFLGANIWRRTLVVVPLALVIILSTGDYLIDAQQQSASASTGRKAPEMTFQVMDVTVSSGSKADEAPDPGAVKRPVPLMIMIAPVKTEEQARPLVAAPTKTEEQAKPLVAASTAAEKKPAAPPLEQALAGWHHQTLVMYNFNISALSDPFMPIKEVRGDPEEPVEQKDDESLPPLLRLELNQLKLVAITIFSNISGNALASFEDGAGVSYILRQGDRIGRNNGRIIRIEPTKVTVEEFPRTKRNEDKALSRIVEMSLNVFNNSTGLTRSGNIVEPPR